MHHHLSTNSLRQAPYLGLNLGHLEADLGFWVEFSLTQVSATQVGMGPAHDVAHLLRVFRNCLLIGRGLPQADLVVLSIAAIFHDSRSFPKGHPQAPLSSGLSAEFATSALSGTALSSTRIALVADAIASHSFSANRPCTTLEAQILSDADKLDALGAVGIARLFATAGEMGSALYDFGDPMAVNRPLNDKANALDHVKTKLAKLPGAMFTDPARELAKRRLAVLQKYCSDLLEEIASVVDETKPV